MLKPETHTRRDNDASISSRDSLSVLLPSPKHRASKRFRWLGSETLRCEASYEAGYQFRAYELDGLSGIRDLAEGLERIESADVDRGLFVLRGELRDEARSRRLVNRQYKDRNDDPHWRRHPVGRRWVMLDLDDLEPPPWFEPPVFEPELDRAIEYAIAQLPDCFEGVTTFYQWSSSAGLQSTPDGEDLYRPRWSDLRLHLWYWLDRPACSESLRDWLREFSDTEDVPLDWRVFNPVQPHFVAPPVFVDGPDPLGTSRSGLLEQMRERVSLPETVVDRPTYQQQQQQRREQREQRRERIRNRPRRRSKAQMESAVDSYAQAALDSACDTVATAPVGARETTLRDESFGVGTLVGAGALDRSTALQRLVQAGEAAGLPSDEATDKATRALEAGMEEPRDLTEVRRELDDSTSPKTSSSSSCDTHHDGPSVDELREHFESASDDCPDYTPPTLEVQEVPDGRALTDVLMERCSIETFIPLVERLRRQAPESLPDEAMMRG